MVGGVVELLGGGLGEADDYGARVLGGHRHPVRQVRPRGRVQHRVGEGLEGEPDVLGGDRPAVLPPGAGTEMEAPGQRVDPLPPAGQRGAIRGGVDRRAAGRQVGEPLVDLVADVASHRFHHQRREELRRLARRGDHDRAATRARARLTRAAGRSQQRRGRPYPGPVSSRRSHARLGGDDGREEPEENRGRAVPPDAPKSVRHSARRAAVVMHRLARSPTSVAPTPAEAPAETNLNSDPTRCRTRSIPRRSGGAQAVAAAEHRTAERYAPCR